MDLCDPTPREQELLMDAYELTSAGMALLWSDQ